MYGCRSFVIFSSSGSIGIARTQKLTRYEQNVGENMRKKNKKRVIESLRTTNCTQRYVQTDMLHTYIVGSKKICYDVRRPLLDTRYFFVFEFFFRSLAVPMCKLYCSNSQNASTRICVYDTTERDSKRFLLFRSARRCLHIHV
jgi:hypothetical protein